MAINIIKSVLFNLHFYMLTFLLIIVMSPVLILPFWFVKIVAKIWGAILVIGMKIWLGLNLKIIGNYNKNKPCIIAVDPSRFNSNSFATSFIVKNTPLPVAASLPSEPPRSTGLPVTIAGLSPLF